MKVNTTPKRFLSVRLTPEELQEVYELSKISTCRSLTEYVKKVLTKKPVTIKVRNQSQDELLAAITGIKNRVDQLADMAQDKDQLPELRELVEIKSMIRKVAEICSREMAPGNGIGV